MAQDEDDMFVARRRLFLAQSAGAAAALSLGGAAMTGADEATAQQRSYGQLVEEANRNTITIASGAPGETSLRIAHDLSTVLHCVDGLRIIPIAGRGDANNIYDLLFLRGVDMAIVRADVLDYLSETDAFIDNLKSRIAYVAPLFDQEVHLITGENIERLEDLDGKLVNIGATGSLALASRRILESAGVSVIASKFDNALALERVVDGGLDGMFITGGAPIEFLDQLANVSGLRLVSLPRPAQHPVYKAASFTHNNYPSLVRAGDVIDTVSVPTVLAVYNWPSDNPRYEKNAIFSRAFFRRASYLRRPARHPKWGDAQLGSEVAGWRRFVPAQEMVDSLGLAPLEEPETPALTPVASAEDEMSEDAMQAAFERQLEEFGITPRTAEEREQLWQAFRRREAARLR